MDRSELITSTRRIQSHNQKNEYIFASRSLQIDPRIRCTSLPTYFLLTTPQRTHKRTRIYI